MENKIVKFVRLKLDPTTRNYYEDDANDLDLAYLGYFLSQEIFLEESPRDFYIQWLNKELVNTHKDKNRVYSILGNSPYGLVARDGMVYIYDATDLEDNSPVYFCVTFEKMKEIIFRWLAIARSTYKLDNIKYELPDEILIEEKDGQITIRRSDNFEPKDIDFQIKKSIPDRLGTFVNSVESLSSSLIRKIKMLCRIDY